MSQTFTPVDELSYEDARDELINTVKILELGQMNLDESLVYWERGEELAAYCERYLTGARERVNKLINPDNEGDSESADESTHSEHSDAD